MSKSKMGKEAKLAIVAGGVILGAMSFHPPTADGAEATKTTATAKSSGLSKHMLDIRFCESSNNYRAVNKQSPSHTGAFQFADSTWAEYKTGYKHAKDAPASVQDAIAIKEHAKNGDRPWLASKPCWSKR